MRSLKDLSFNIFQKYYNRYELSELTYPIRRLFEPSKKKFGNVMVQLVDIASEFQKKSCI